MNHTLSDYIALLEERNLLDAPVPETLDRSAVVELVSYDSREVVPGTLFLCKGAHFKAEFLKMARKRGAVAYVSEIPYPESGLPCIQVSDMRRTIAPLADLFYGHPSGRLPVIGITDTGGAVVITGYDAQNIICYEPGQAETVRMGMKDSAAMFEQAGNLFFTYLPQEGL